MSGIDASKAKMQHDGSVSNTFLCWVLVALA